MREEDCSNDHRDGFVVDRAIRGELQAGDQAILKRHLADCACCAAEVESARVFDAWVAPGPEDDALGRLAVESALARLGERRSSALKWQWLRRPAMGLAALGAAAVVAILFVFPLARRPFPRPEAGVATGGPIVLADGSEIAPDGATTAIQIGEQTPARTTVRLPSGGARFRIRHDHQRLFRVYAGAFEIQDLGTAFRVIHETGGRIRVAVSEGRVAVLCGARGLHVELGAGDDRVFSATTEARDGLEPTTTVPKPPEPATGQSPARVQPRAPHLTDDPAQLLAAADVARRSRTPQAAVPSLRRLVEHYPKDPRAPSAAFTLGWVLLTDLNRPREAAVAFAEAERIARRGALAEDAAARVAEAWQKAGESRRAAEAARHYEQVYPQGRYIGLMRGLAGGR